MEQYIFATTLTVMFILALFGPMWVCLSAGAIFLIAGIVIASFERK
jgi:hypothetical protein